MAHEDVDNAEELADAIEALNASTGPHTISLHTNDEAYIVREPRGDLFGPLAFPTIIQDITIYGGGLAITRAYDADEKFRFFGVDAKSLDTYGKLTLDNLKLFNGDSGDAGGGAIVNDGETIIIGCHFSGNVADTLGGAIYAGDAKPVEIENSTFSNNIAAGEDSRGGAIYASGNSDLTITDCVFFRNKVQGTNSQGSAIFIATGALAEMTGSDISCNSVEDSTNEAAVYSTNILFTAQNNWWGDANGPDGGGVSGPGQVVGGNVDATSYLLSPSTRVVHVWYNRGRAALHAILTSRNNFTGSVFEVGDGDTPVNNSPPDVGGPFSYPSGILDHTGIKTGSAIFMSESMYAGNLPMNYGIDLSNNVEDGDCNQDSGSGISGWRVCLGDNLGASQTWKSHPVLREYLTSYQKGFVVNPPTPPDPEGLSFDTVDDYINFGSNGTVTDDELYLLFDNEYAEVQTGDYIVVNQDNGVYHGFLIVGWGPVVNSLDALNARLDTESGVYQTEFTIKRRPNTIPYVADFCYGYHEGDISDPQYHKTGWLQDPRPRPFYCSALRIEDDNAFDSNVVGMTILGSENYWERIRTAFQPFIYDGNPSLRPNWIFIHVPDSVDVRYDRFLCP